MSGLTTDEFIERFLNMSLEDELDKEYDICEQQKDKETYILKDSEGNNEECELTLNKPIGANRYLAKDGPNYVQKAVFNFYKDDVQNAPKI